MSSALALAIPHGVAQTPVRPEFEVATIKPNVSGCCTFSRWSADQVTFSNQTLMHLIIFSYGLQREQIDGPEWMKSIRFDVTAKFPPGTKFADCLLMLRTLLEDRLKLAVHHGSKEMEAYELVVGPGGFRLKPSEPGPGSYGSGEQNGIRTFTARKIAISDLAYDLADSLDEPVIDKTGVGGGYNFRLSWAANDLGNSEAGDAKPAPSLSTALHEVLGLRLVHRKTSVPIIVVDHVDRAPSEN